jgi:hypothetical protein
MERRALLKTLAAALGLLLCGTPQLACAEPQAAAPEREGFGELSADQVEQLIKKKEAQVFDNNSEERYQRSHLPGATWLKFNEVKASDLPKDLERTLVFYCANTH